MSRFLDRPAGVLAFLLVAVACFSSVVFRGEQFAYRDAASYYYPLHARTVDQWKLGQLPLWDPDQNGGQPLLGNPTAAVLYPGKLVFAALPYSWAARIYLIGHVGLAFVAMTVCLRGFGVSPTGSRIGGLSYAFGGPVLLQYANAIYLVGSAWLPLGVRSADVWLRQGRPRGLVGLALVLAMQVLGGDLQVAYALGLFAAGYAVWLVMKDRVRAPSLTKLAIAAGVWVAATPLLAAWLPSFRDASIAPWVVARIGQATRYAVLAGLVWTLVRSAGARHTGTLVRKMAGLVAAAAVGASIAGAQLLPVAELSTRSFRMTDEARMDPFAYSLEPYRALELIWPGVFGIEFPENRWWVLAIPPIDSHLPWVSTLFVGSLTLLLAIVALSGRDAPPWRTIMAFTVVIALVLSLGMFASPLWWARAWPELESGLGPRGSNGMTMFRAEDGRVIDAFGSPYWMLSTLAPGFGSFRFPAKFLVFVSLGISALAALGWDRVGSGLAVWPGKFVAAVLGLSAVMLLVSVVFQGSILSWLEDHARVPSLAGPIDPAGALGEFRRSMIHTLIGFALAGALLAAAHRRRSWAGAAAMMLLGLDLAIANARFVWTVPQSDFETPSRLAEAIRAAESKRDPASVEPFRIQRMHEWHPLRFVVTRSADRLRELIAWHKDTLKSGYGTLHGLSYTLSPGVIEPADFLHFFDPWVVKLPPSTARTLGLRPGQPIRYAPRRAFDLWGARYFILPRAPFDWLDPSRAIASFLPGTELVAPEPEILADPALQAEWIENQDWQLVRNVQAFPRAWIVHNVVFRRDPIATGSPEAQALKRTILYAADAYWNLPGRPVEDMKTTAWVQGDGPPPGISLDAAPPSSTETVSVVRDEPALVELEARLERDGLVVLSAQDFPGWTLTIDGTPSPILKTNLAMRGALVPSGTHRLVYRYEPRSLRIGLGFTVGGLLVTAIALFATRNRREAQA